MFYYNHTVPGRPHPVIHGAFETTEEANANRDLLVAAHPGDEVGEVYEAEEDPRLTAPRPTQITNQGGVDYTIWSDGTAAPVE